jgi:hypothetical protein
LSLQSVGFSWRKAVWSRAHGDCKSSSAGFYHLETMHTSDDEYHIKCCTLEDEICFRGKYRG